MAEKNVAPITRVESETNVNRAIQIQNMKAEAARASQEAQEAKHTAEAHSKPASETKPEIESVKSADIGLKFMVNEDTKQVTVYVVDRASNRVIRSIPPDELNNLKAGDLIELLA